MSTVDLLQPPPAPARAHKSLSLHWFRLVVISLVLIRILAALPGVAWARLRTSRRPAGGETGR